MSTLKDRLAELMAAKHWEHADLVRISGQSSSVVSQWLGKGSKEIKSIGQIDAALRLQQASGFNALWIAKGQGPKHAPPPPPAPLTAQAREAAPAYGVDNIEATLHRMGQLLAAAPVENRQALADVLRGWALDGGGGDREAALHALLQGSREKRRA